MTETAVQTALNVLSLLEEYNPEESQRLRRLLPALARDFARAGYYPSERQMLELINESAKGGQPLQSLFNRQKQKQNLSYAAILARLSDNHPRQNYRDRILAYGHYDHFLKNEEHYRWSSGDYAIQAVAAAQRGHTELCQYFLSHWNFSKELVNTCLQEAALQSQYHLASALLQSSPDSHEHFIGNLTHEQSLSFAEFLRKARYFSRASDNFNIETLTGLEDFELYHLPVKSYLGIRKMLGHEIENVRERNIEAYKATLLFRSPEKLLRMLDRWGTPAEKPLSHMLSQIHIPYGAAVNWKGWGDGLLRHGMDMSHLLFFSDRLPSPISGASGDISLRLTAYDIWRKILTRPHQRQLPEDADDLNGNLERYFRNFREASKIWRAVQKVPEPAPEWGVPDIRFDCAPLGLPGYRLAKFSYDDPRILFMGYYTGCCEKVGDDFQETIFHALRTKRSGFYTLMKDDEIRAHSWVWRGKEGQLVIDGWESKDPSINTQNMDWVTHKVADILSRPQYEKYDICDVLLGVSGLHLDPEKNLNPAATPADRFLCTWYYQGFEETQWQVKRLKQPSDHPRLPPSGHKPQL